MTQSVLDHERTPSRTALIGLREPEAVLAEEDVYDGSPSIATLELPARGTE